MTPGTARKRLASFYRYGGRVALGDVFWYEWHWIDTARVDAAHPGQAYGKTACGLAYDQRPESGLVTVFSPLCMPSGRQCEACKRKRGYWIDPGRIFSEVHKNVSSVYRARRVNVNADYRVRVRR